MTDDVLMQRVRDGDDDAFAEIVDRYKDPLVNYLTHLARSRERAEEIAQDAFVRLYDNASRYRQRDRLGPYLYRIATNLLVSAIRRERRWNLLVPRLTAGTPRSAVAPDRELLESEIQRLVSDALDGLPLKYRAPLVLFEIEEWTYDAIATALGVRIGTVKSRISRARELLRRQLAPWWTGGMADGRTRVERPASRLAARESVARFQP